MNYTEVINILDHYIMVASDYSNFLESSVNKLNFENYRQLSTDLGIQLYSSRCQDLLNKIFEKNVQLLKDPAYKEFFLAKYIDIVEFLNQNETILSVEQANILFNKLKQLTEKFSDINISLLFLRDKIYGDNFYKGLSPFQLFEELDSNSGYFDRLTQKQIEKLFEISQLPLFNSEILKNTHKLEFSFLDQTDQVSLLEFLDFLRTNLNDLLSIYITMLDRVVSLIVKI